jgi:vacuolar-type H+-ATPase subunit H
MARGSDIGVFWLNALKYLKISAVWCQQHWRWVVLIIAFIIVYLLGKRNAGTYKIQADLAKERYKKEKEAIERAHELEIKKRNEANKRYSDAVKKIEKKYEKNKSEITHSKKEKIKAMVNKAKESPEDIDRILEQELGIKKHETN